MKRIPKQDYTAEFKEQAVKRAQEVGVGVAARELGLVVLSPVLSHQVFPTQLCDAGRATFPHWVPR